MIIIEGENSLAESVRHAYPPLRTAAAAIAARGRMDGLYGENDQILYLRADSSLYQSGIQHSCMITPDMDPSAMQTQDFRRMTYAIWGLPNIGNIAGYNEVAIRDMQMDIIYVSPVSQPEAVKPEEVLVCWKVENQSVVRVSRSISHGHIQMSLNESDLSFVDGKTVPDQLQGLMPQDYWRALCAMDYKHAVRCMSALRSAVPQLLRMDRGFFFYAVGDMLQKSADIRGLDTSS